MRNSSPDSSALSFSQRKTPFAVPESCTTSWGPSKRKTACSGAMNGSLSSLTSLASTSRPTLVSSLIRTKSALRLPSRAIAETRARGRTGAAGFAGAGGRAWPVTGFGGGGGTGRGAAAAAFGGGGGDFGAAGGCAGAGGGLEAAAFGPGAAVAPNGVPQRAQNLKVDAFSVMQFGHCFGGAPCASRGELTFPAAGADAPGFWAMVGRLVSLIAAPQDRQEPTSVSLCAPQRGQSMRSVLCRCRKKGQGVDLRGAFRSFGPEPGPVRSSRWEACCRRRIRGALRARNAPAGFRRGLPRSACIAAHCCRLPLRSRDSGSSIG